MSSPHSHHAPHAFHTGQRPGSYSSALPGDQGACTALVDARFLQWLCRPGEEEREDPAGAGEPAGLPRDRLAEVLGGALRGARVGARVTRVFWYTSQAAAASVDGQVMRFVPPESVDGGAGLVLAMARDALQLAEQRACSHLLIASDDDRLLATVDAVQMRGLRVHLLADDSALDLASLQQSDPAWASLLRQADTRLVVRDLQHSPGRGPRREREGGSADELEAIPPLVNAWLAGLSETTRLMLHDQLPTQRGLPQEADRELLQQLSHRLGRPLTVPERKLMRELARRSLADRGLPADESESEDEPQRAIP